ncbi:MAG: TAXI family TRAP transporter solute-binding subunit [Rhodospirillales bacterium]|nr:TAXI family TRAP transporter solute-binding subunit [Rhodospirillales bacterium]
MKRWTIPLSLIAAVPMAIAGFAMSGTSADARDFVRVATAGSGGNYYRLGSGLAAIWNDKVPDVQASIQATGGTVENLDLLAEKQVEIAYLAGSVGKQAYDNTGTFAQRPKDRYKGLRAIATVYPNPQWFIAMQWAPEIKSLKDLKGKRVSVGTQGSQGEAWWRMIMGHLGMTYSDISAEYTVHQSAIDQVRNRRIDAIVWPDAPGSSSIQQVMDTGFARIIDIDADVVAFMDAQGLDYPYTIPGEHVPSSKQPVKTFAAPTTLASHAEVSDELVYNLVKTMFENKERLIGVHPLANFMTLENALDGLPFPLHPGAEKFYAEKGMKAK